MAILKVCSICGQSLPIEAFSPNGNGLVRANCKKCAAQKHREGRTQDPEKYRAWGRKAQQKRGENGRAWQRAYYAATREARLETVRVYREANKEQIKAKRATLRAEHPEVIREWKRREYTKHRDANIARSRARYAAKPEAYAASAKANYLAHSAEYKSRARARQKGLAGKYTQSEVNLIYAAQFGMCAGCRSPLGKKYEIDHVMPVSLGGANTADNLQLLCTLCNRRKHAMHPDAWAARLGKLFV